MMKQGKAKKISSLMYVTDLIRRYRQGDVSEKEREMLEEWIPDQRMLNTVDQDNPLVDVSTERVWKQITEQIRKGRDRRPKLVIRRFTKYAAAAVALALIIGGLWYMVPRLSDGYSGVTMAQADKTYYQTTGESPVMRITLPDGSNIQLNKETSLYIVQNQFNRRIREVWLEEGEAFFEVAKDTERPFIVYHGDLQTVVRGTSFNIKAYKSLHENVVSVRSGKVEVGSAGQLYGTLTSNKQLNYKLDDRSADISDVKWNDACGWMDDRLVLNKANADELKLRIKQHFGKEVTIEGTALHTMLLTASFEKGTSLGQVMEIISAMYGVNYRITHSQVILYD